MKTTEHIPDPVTDLPGYSDYWRRKFLDIKLREDSHNLSTGNPLHQPYDVGVLYAVSHISSLKAGDYHSRATQEGEPRSIYSSSYADVANKYYGSGPLYGADAYAPFIQKLGITNPLTNENIVPGNGTTHLYSAAVRELLTKDDVLLVPVPTYGFFIDPRRLWHTNVRPLLLRAEDGFKLTPEYLDQEITRLNKELAAGGKKLKISALLHINPNNPTGVVYNKKEIDALAAVIKKHGLRLVIDDMVYSGLEYENLGTQLPNRIAAPMASAEGMFDKTVTLIGLSKAYSLPSLRAGLAVGPKALIEPIRKSIACDMEFTSHVSQAAMMGVFSGRHEKERVQYLGDQAAKFVFKNLMVRLMVNGWEKDSEATNMLRGSDIDVLAERLFPAATLIAKNYIFLPREIIDDDGRLGDLSGSLFQQPAFQKWIIKHANENEEVRDIWNKLNESMQGNQNQVVGAISELYRRFVRDGEATLGPTEMEDIYNSLKEEQGKITKQKMEFKKIIESGLPGLHALSAAEAGFFLLVDATDLKGRSYHGKKLKTSADIAEAIAQEGNTSVLPGEAMGYYGDRLLLRISFSDEMPRIVEGIQGIEKFLAALDKDQTRWTGKKSQGHGASIT